MKKHNKNISIRLRLFVDMYDFFFNGWWVGSIINLSKELS